MVERFSYDIKKVFRFLDSIHELNNAILSNVYACGGKKTEG